MSVARPTGIVIAAVLQLLLAIALLVSATVALMYGPAAQAAGEAAMPGWYSHTVRVRFALATLGSLVVLILLAVPSARAWFRAQPVTVEDSTGSGQLLPDHRGAPGTR